MPCCSKYYAPLLKALCPAVQSIMPCCSKYYAPLFKVLIPAVQSIMPCCSKYYALLLKAVCPAVQSIMPCCSKYYALLFKVLCPASQSIMPRFAKYMTHTSHLNMHTLPSCVSFYTETPVPNTYSTRRIRKYCILCIIHVYTIAMVPGYRIQWVTHCMTQMILCLDICSMTNT